MTVNIRTRRLTLVAPIHFGFSDKCRRVDTVTSQEDIVRVSIASADIAWRAATGSPAVVAFILGLIVSPSENSELNYWLNPPPTIRVDLR